MIDAVTVTYSTEQVRKMAHGNDVFIKAKAAAELLAKGQKRELSGDWHAHVVAGTYTVAFTLAPAT